jgi:hypothetical protein
MKCKLCNNFIEGICIVFSRHRSPGKKRFCTHFDEKKIVRRPVRIIRVPWMSKSDRKKEILRRRVEVAKLVSNAKLLEQQQALVEQEKQKPELITHAEPVIAKKGKGFFKKIFNRGGEK